MPQFQTEVLPKLVIIKQSIIATTMPFKNVKVTVGKTSLRREIVAFASRDSNHMHMVFKMPPAKNSRPATAESSTKMGVVSPKHSPNRRPKRNPLEPLPFMSSRLVFIVARTITLSRSTPRLPPFTFFRHRFARLHSYLARRLLSTFWPHPRASQHIVKANRLKAQINYFRWDEYDLFQRPRVSEHCC